MAGVIANAKHWVDNSQETNRTTNIANVDERTQMEVYYPPFEAAVKAGRLSNFKLKLAFSFRVTTYCCSQVLDR